MGRISKKIMTVLLFYFFFFFVFLLYIWTSCSVDGIITFSSFIYLFSFFQVACEGKVEGLSYTLVVECPWGKFVLFCPPLNVLKVCKGCIPVNVFGIMVMVLGVMSGMSSGDLLKVSV